MHKELHADGICPWKSLVPQHFDEQQHGSLHHTALMTAMQTMINTMGGKKIKENKTKIDPSPNAAGLIV